MRLLLTRRRHSLCAQAAAHFGLEFIEKQHGVVTLRDCLTKGKDAQGKPIACERSFEVLEVLDFTSARKRMSVIVSDPATGAIRLFSKGADNVMLPLLNHLAIEAHELRTMTEKVLEDHANDGLRTLVLAHKQLTREGYDAWSARYRAALTDVAELDKKEKELPNAIDNLMSEMEAGLSLLGTTAIEDKLQVTPPAATPPSG